MNRTGSCLAFVATVVLVAPAFAEETRTWGMSGDWEILVDPDTGNGCLMQSRLDDGLILQFGAEPLRKGGFVAAYNQAWSFLEDGSSGTVRFEFPDVIFEGDVAIEVRNGLPGGRAFFDNPNLPFEFAKRRSMTIVGQKVGRIEVQLDGTFSAIQAVRACQGEQVLPSAD
jgi:hypothetical protein